MLNCVNGLPVRLMVFLGLEQTNLCYGRRNLKGNNWNITG